jgi:hypothetical protein
LLIAAMEGAKEIFIMHGNPEKVSDVLSQIRKSLDMGKPKEAMEFLRKYGTGSLELSDAYGVALMRMGEASKAVEVYRGICLFPGSVCFKVDLPTGVITNFATALLLDKNVTGCLALLDELHQEQDPSVRRLRAAIDRWRHSLSWWNRIACAWFGADLDLPVTLDYPPGELLARREGRPAA